MNLNQMLAAEFRAAWTNEPPDIVEWAEENVVLPSSARSKRFNLSITPWLEEPLRRAVDRETRIVTLVKPVQSGGSVFGEVLLLYWIMFSRGFLQYNWSNDKRAKDRWESRIEGILKACAPILKRMNAMERFSGQKCEIDFGNVFFRMQGAFVSDNLDSDSIHLQINEEVHAWEPGHHAKARNRSTAVWNFKSIDISNAGNVGSQLDTAWKAGTMQWWLNKCPGCGLYHRMKTRFEPSRPDLGGLRYDSTKRDDGSYDYNKIRSTIRYQMPCGYLVHDDHRARRHLSENAIYSEPTNTGAEVSHRSYCYDSVAVDYIDWMKLIKDKHEALQQRKYGNLEAWIKYVTEKECVFYDPDDVPVVGSVTLSPGIKMNRGGFPLPQGNPHAPGNKIRFFALDRQQGNKNRNEFPYWWLLIRDVALDEDGTLKSLLVYEGRLETNDQVIGVLKDHECKMWHGVADSGDDTTEVYLFCLQWGINAIKGGKEDFYVHANAEQARRIFSPERPLHSMVNRPPKYPYYQTSAGLQHDPREPMFWLYSKSGIRERLNWLRENAVWLVPDDVSEDYKRHQESEERIPEKNKHTGEVKHIWIQQKVRNDQFVNECYIAMQVEMAGLVQKAKLIEEQKK